jgi:hypothetical protein
LAEWQEEVCFKALSETLKGHVKEHYMWEQLHDQSSKSKPEPYSSLQKYTQQFNALAAEQKDAYARRVCDIYTMIEYCLRTQFIPEHLHHHTTGGDQRKHWENIPANSPVLKQRQRTLERMQKMKAS